MYDFFATFIEIIFSFVYFRKKETEDYLNFDINVFLCDRAKNLKTRGTPKSYFETKIWNLDDFRLDLLSNMHAYCL